VKIRGAQREIERQLAERTARVIRENRVADLGDPLRAVADSSLP
jgi:hypothetical protein